MAVGTLSIATTAPTEAARSSVNALRGDIRGIPADCAVATTGLARLEAQVTHTVSSLQRRQTMAMPTLTPLADPNTVDLRGHINRLQPAAERSASSLSVLKGAMKLVTFAARALSFVGIVAGIGTVVVAAVRGKEAWLELGKSLLHVSGIGRLVGRVLGTEAIDAKTKELDEKINKMNATRAAADKAFAERRSEAEFDRRESLGFNVDRQYGKDAAEFGTQRAVELARMREETARNEAIKAAEREATERRIEGIKERNRRAEAAADKRRQALAEDARTLEELRKQNRQFHMTDNQKRRDDTLRGIEDPRQRSEAAGLLERLEFRERHRRQRERESANEEIRRNRPGFKFLDANTAEGRAQMRTSLRRDGPQEKILKANERQAQASEDLLRWVREKQGGAAFDPFESG